jgi:hypothetical protein
MAGQNYANFEPVVVDGASTDETLARITRRGLQRRVALACRVSAALFLIVMPPHLSLERWAAPRLRALSQSVTIHPGDDIQRQVDDHGWGTTFVLTSGVYRLQSITPKNGDSFIGEPGAILTGAKLLASFKPQERFWVAIENIKQVKGSGNCLPERPACAFPEDLFVDDAPLQRVANLSDVIPGKWSLDYDAGKIYLADNPSGHKIEISVTPHAFYGSASNVTIRGLIIEKYAAAAQAGAINNFTADEGPTRWVVAENEVRLCHGGGVQLGAGGQLLRNKIHHNGQIGVVGRGQDILIDGNEIAHNNFAGYDYNWEAGGTKFLLTENLMVRNNYVHDNRGPGLWTDGDNYNVVYEHNRTTGNTIAGIFHEISFRAVIRFNTIENDGINPRGGAYGAGIFVSASANVEVYGNNVTNCMNGIRGFQEDRGSNRRSGKPYLVQNLYVHDNIITQTSGIAAGILKVGKFDNSIFTSWNNRFENNTYNLVDPTGKYYQWMDVARSRVEWQEFGNDVHGRWLTPAPAFPPVPIKKEALPE